MSCEWRTKLDQYVDSELSATELAEMETHLRTCATCATDALSRLQLKRATQSAGRHFSPASEFRLKIEQSIGAPKTRRSAWRWLPALLAAAALVLIAIATPLWLQHSRSEQALNELADLHVSTLASQNPVDVISSDRHTVKPWFQGKLPFSFNLPELQATPFKLIGGRLTYFQQSPGAQLIFETGKHEISVFIFQNRADSPRPSSGSSLTVRLGLQSTTWTEGGLWHFVIGDANPTDIHALSNLLRAAK